MSLVSRLSCMTRRSVWVVGLSIIAILGVYLPLEAFDGDDQDGLQEATLRPEAAHRRPAGDPQIFPVDFTGTVTTRGWTAHDDPGDALLVCRSSRVTHRHTEELRASHRCARAQVAEPHHDRVVLRDLTAAEARP